MCMSDLKPPQRSSSGFPMINDRVEGRYNSPCIGNLLLARTDAVSKILAIFGKPPPPCHNRNKKPNCLRMSMGTSARGRKAMSTSGSKRIARTMEKTCADPAPNVSVARYGSRPVHSARARQSSRGAPVSSSWSMMEGAVAPMLTEFMGSNMTRRARGTVTPTSSSGSSSPVSVVGCKCFAARPKKLRSTRSFLAVTCKSRPRGKLQALIRSSAKTPPTLKPGGRTNHVPCSKAITFSSGAETCFDCLRKSCRFP
mmetsp:Transcript_59257/g.166201  ORF Transcript_59257/g.166201 Transcript_59257/m.166201 type:complete len:255 (-) Transcript_59257:634-1398(-)